MIVDYESLIARVKLQVARPEVVGDDLAKVFIADAEADIRRVIEVPDMLTVIDGAIQPAGIPIPEDCRRLRWVHVGGRKVTMPPAKVSAKLIIDAGKEGEAYLLEYWRHYSQLEQPRDSNWLLITHPDIYWRPAVAYAMEFLRDHQGYRAHMDQFVARAAEVNSQGRANMIATQMVLK